MNSHDNLLRDTELENSVVDIRTVEAELKDPRHAACEAAARLQKTDAELRRSLSA